MQEMFKMQENTYQVYKRWMLLFIPFQIIIKYATLYIQKHYFKCQNTNILNILIVNI